MKKALYNFRSLVTLSLFIISIATLSAQTYDLTVAQDGSGNFTTVQAAVDAAPLNLTSPYKIFIKKGVYFEKITVMSNKPFLQFIGESLQNVILTYDDYSGKPGIGTANSASVTINATDFFATNITFANSTGESPQALAINANNDRIAFFNCRFLGGQDTVLCNGLTSLRHYFKNCYIDGTVDFIFGGATAIFEDCIIYARDRSISGSSYITAANTQEGTPYGFTFINSVIPPNRGATKYWLGRPWQNDGTNPRVSQSKTVFINSKMSSTILPVGWSVWTPATITSVITYAESQTKNLDGSTYDVSQRVNWSKQLTSAEANEYTMAKIFGNWNPCTLNSILCGAFSPSIAVSNFKAIKGTSSTPTKISWNACWAIKDVKYELLSAVTKNGTYSPIFNSTTPNDTTYNFDVLDTIPSPTKAFYYVVRGSRAGLTTYTSDTLIVSSIPTISLGAIELKDFLQSIGKPSSVKIYSLQAENLLTDVKVTVPPNFEISLDGGATWKKGIINITPTNKVIASINILVRLNASSVGSFTGDIIHESTSAVISKVNVTGITQTAALKVSKTLVHYPFTTDATDSLILRDAGLEPLQVQFVNTSISNGLSNVGATALLPFSVLHGMSYGAGADGLGLWSTASGGPGGAVKRITYIEFKIAATKKKDLLIDSLILNNTFYLTASSTKLAVVYSLSGFRNDSTDISGGIGSNGLPLSSTTGTGSFAAPVTLVQDNAGNFANFRLAFLENGSLKVKSGDTLTIRLYHSCSSSSQGRYTKIKDLIIKGESINPNEGILMYYPFKTNASDDADTRNAGIMAGTPSLFNLSVSNNMSNSGSVALAPYSMASGMAISAGTMGLGSWSTGAGGPGGTLRRNFYVEYKVKPNAGYRVKVDSLVLNSSFYFTASSTKLAVVYSKSDFVSDSTDVSDSGTGPDGLPLLPTAFGSFANPIVILQENDTTSRNYRLPINGSIGVDVAPNETLTIRMYFSCSSSSLGRYAKIKDFYIKGTSILGTGVKEDLQKFNGFSILQNPVFSNLTIQHPQVQSKSSFNIFNTLGRKVKTIAGQGGSETQINIIDLTAGNYYLEAVSGNNRQVMKFIKY